jgi:hypothetical protein
VSGSNGLASRSIYGLAAIALALAGCSSLAEAPATGVGVPTTQAPMTHENRPASGSQDLYIGNILGGVPLYSTGKNPHEVGDITDKLPRVTSAWVDQTGVLYAFTDNPQYPYETIEEFEPGSTSPFFSLTLQHYGTIVAADSAQNVYAQGEAVIDGQGQQVIDVYPPGSQNYANEYVVPPIGRVSEPQGMAFDSTGALLVGVAALASNKRGQVGAVFRLNASSSTFLNLNLKKAYGGAIATDGAENLYVGGGTLISVYAPGATSPSRIVHTKGPLITLMAASNGTLYVDTSTGGITLYAAGKVKSKNSFVPQAQVSGLALGPR